jgi:hypothetical protein
MPCSKGYPPLYGLALQEPCGYLGLSSDAAGTQEVVQHAWS